MLWEKTGRFSGLSNHKVEFGASTAARKCEKTLRKESSKEEKVQILCINSSQISLDLWTSEVQSGLQEVQLRIKELNWDQAATQESEFVVEVQPI